MSSADTSSKLIFPIMRKTLFSPDKKMELFVASLSQAAAANINPLEHVQHNMKQIDLDAPEKQEKR